MPDLPHPLPMTTFDPSRRRWCAIRRTKPSGNGPVQWEQGASWHWLTDGSTALNWHGLLIEGWQPIDDTTPRLPLPEDRWA